jgi:hypothetical protein
MSEQEQQPKTNNALTERVNGAYIANNYTLLNGGTENVIMISGDKDDASADMLLTLEGMEEVAKTLRAEVDAIKKPESDGHEE